MIQTLEVTMEGQGGVMVIIVLGIILATIIETPGHNFAHNNSDPGDYYGGRRRVLWR
jgi:hypothetical protein